MNIVLKGLIALLIATGVAGVMSKQAVAGAVCDRTGLCGKVYVEKASKTSIVVANDWSDKLKRPPDSAGKMYVKPGKSSTYKDTDAYLTHRTCTTWRMDGGTYIKQAKNKWYKIYDYMHVVLKTTC